MLSKNNFMIKILFSFFLLNFLFANENYSYIEEYERPKTFVEGMVNNQGSYLRRNFLKHIDKNEVSMILEIGSLDAIDAIKISEYYKVHVFAFECNPEAIEYCIMNIGNNPNITLVNYAVWNETKEINFYPVIEGIRRINNPGASSCFEFSVKSQAIKQYIQSKITVPAIRLDDWMKMNKIPQIDLICMDAQGAALEAFEGLGDELQNVKYIITELENFEIYKGEALAKKIVDFLDKKGFKYIAGSYRGLFDDFLFIRKDLLIEPLSPKGERFPVLSAE